MTHDYNLITAVAEQQQEQQPYIFIINTKRVFVCNLSATRHNLFVVTNIQTFLWYIYIVGRQYLMRLVYIFYKAETV